MNTNFRSQDQKQNLMQSSETELQCERECRCISAQRNIRWVLMLNFAWSFLLIQSIIVAFYQSRGLSMRQIFMISSVFSMTLAVFDVPTGYLSDLFGRRKILILAGLAKGLGGSILWLSDGYYGFMLAFFFIGIANSLFSGSDLSVIYDSLDAMGKRQDASHVLRQRFIYSQVGTAFSAVLGSWMGQHSFYSALLLNSVFAWFCLFFAMNLIEVRNVSLGKSHKENLKFMLQQLLFVFPRLRIKILHRILVLVMLLISATLVQESWRQLNLPIHVFGWISAGFTLASAVLSQGVGYLQNYWKSSSLHLFCGTLPFLGFLAMGLTLNWGPIAFLFGFVFEVVRILSLGFQAEDFNRDLDSRVRATGNSLVSMSSRVAFALLAPLVGFVTDHHGLKIALLVCALLSSFIPVLMIYHFKKYSSE